MKKSDKTVEQFIRKDSEERIKQFFTTDMDIVLKDYKEGEPTNKQDVLQQTKEIEEKRNKMEAEHNAQQQDNGPITLQEPGKPPVVLKSSDVIKLINGLREQLKVITIQHKELLEINGLMHNKIISMKNEHDIEIEKLRAISERLPDKIEITESQACLDKL